MQQLLVHCSGFERYGDLARVLGRLTCGLVQEIFFELGALFQVRFRRLRDCYLLLAQIKILMLRLLNTSLIPVTSLRFKVVTNGSLISPDRFDLFPKHLIHFLVHIPSLL